MNHRSLAGISIAVLLTLTATTPIGARPQAPGSVTSGRPPAAVTPSGSPRTVKGDCATPSDCVELTINGDGRVGGLTEGPRVLPMTSGSAGGFSVHMVGNQPNLVVNPGFEQATGWKFPSSGTYRPRRVAVGNAHGGGYVARIEIPGSTPQTSAVATQTVNVSPSTSYVVSAWFKTTSIGPNSTETTAPLSYKAGLAPAFVNVQLLDSGNNLLRENWVFSYTGTSGWSRQTLGLKTPGNAAKIKLSLQLKNGSGTAMFDDVSVTRLIASGSSALTTTTQDETGGAVSQHSTIAGEPTLTLDAIYEPLDHGIEITGIVTDSGATGRSGDRALQVTYLLPLDVTGWSWADTARRARTIKDQHTYGFENGINGPQARYPWATVYDGQSGISLGSPLSLPRGYSMSYTPQGLQITFDLGVSAAATALGGTATFKIQLFRSDETYRAGAVWGMRGAIATYYELNSDSYVVRTDPAREGIPFYQPPIAEITAQAATDLHLGLNVQTMNNLRNQDFSVFDEAGSRDIYSSVYTHHWGYFPDRCTDGGSTCPLRTYEQVAAQVDADAASSCDTVDLACQRNRDEAIAAKRATALDLNGRYRYDFLGTYRLREIPGLTLGSTVEWDEAIKTWQLNLAKDYAAAAPDPTTLDAVYVDSSSGMRPIWGDVDDYDRAKWAVLEEPGALTFAYASGEVTLKSFFANYLHLRRLVAWAAANDAFLVLDTNGKEQTPGGILGTDLADWLLVENSLRDLELPPAGVTPDSFGMLKRVLANQRPVSTVDPRLANGTLRFKDADPTVDTVVSRVNESLFYGIWPGPDRWNSGTATTWWRNQKYIDLYAHYGELLRTLSASGWEPITNASSARATVWLERYGKASDDDLVIALRNGGNATKSVTITVRFDRDGLSGGIEPATMARELVTDQSVSFSDPNGHVGTFTITIPARTTRLVAFDRP
ncbi:MAG: hypothetical protein ABIZ34_10110 [Candidatus Limnocylindrales bacterium]